MVLLYEWLIILFLFAFFKTVKALRNAYAALKLDCNYLYALQLIVLLLSAKKKVITVICASTVCITYPHVFLLSQLSPCFLIIIPMFSYY